MTDDTASVHEEALIRSFIDRFHRARILNKVQNPKTRRKQLDKFNHSYPLDPRYAHLIPPHDQTPDAMYQMLKARGAPNTCYVMGDSALDGHEMPLQQAIQEVVDSQSAHFISCVPGKLAFFQAEDVGQRFILERQQEATIG